MRAARNAAEAKMQTKNKTRRGGSKSSRRAAYLMNKMIPAKRFAKRFFREFFTSSVTAPKQASDAAPPSRAVVPALGQELPRTIGHFQVRRRQKAHRALCKKAPAHPRRGGYTMDSQNTSASKTTLLRCGTQFASYQGLSVFRMRDKLAGRKSSLKSRQLTPRREDFPKGKICGETFSRLFCACTKKCKLK